MARMAASGILPPSRPSSPLTVAQAALAPDPDMDKEADEPPVVAEPPLGREAVLYMEPRPGIDGEAMFGSCASCASFIPEIYMNGAVRGSRCAKFGSAFPIDDDDSCNLYTPWPAGRPCEDCIAHGAMKMRAGAKGAVDPWSVGYVSDTKTQCRYCRFFDAEESECEAFESLNEKSGNLFQLDTAVKPCGACNLWRAPKMEEGYG